MRHGWGSGAHISALSALPEFEITAVCTSRQETADETAKHFGISRAFRGLINVFVAEVIPRHTGGEGKPHARSLCRVDTVNRSPRDRQRRNSRLLRAMPARAVPPAYSPLKLEQRNCTKSHRTALIVEGHALEVGRRYSQEISMKVWKSTVPI